MKKCLVKEIELLLLGYGGKGGKENREQQIARAIAFAAHAKASGACSMGQVGDRHVIRYWKANRHLADSTLYNHWRALCILWEKANKTGVPPKPKKPQEKNTTLRDKLFGKRVGVD